MKKNMGFTLIELLITLSIVAIIAMMALPSYDRFITNNQLNTAARDLRMAMLLTRSEAVKRNASVQLKSNTGWANGLLVTTNGSRNYSDCATSPTADCIQLYQPMSEGVAVSVNDISVTSMEYLRNGRAKENVTFTICPAVNPTGYKKRLISIGTTGTPVISNQGDC